MLWKSMQGLHKGSVSDLTIFELPLNVWSSNGMDPSKQPERAYGTQKSYFVESFLFCIFLYADWIILVH